MSPRYNPLALVADGTDRSGPSADSTEAGLLQATHLATSVGVGPVPIQPRLVMTLTHAEPI
jgi:hypothetical protein